MHLLKATSARSALEFDMMHLLYNVNLVCAQMTKHLQPHLYVGAEKSNGNLYVSQL